MRSEGGSFWNFDERYHEQGIEISGIQPFSYAMAMVADRFHKGCGELYKLA